MDIEMSCKSLIYLTLYSFLYVNKLNCNGFTDERDNETNVTMSIIKHLMENGNKFVSPPNNRPLTIKIQYMIFGFSDISELNMHFTLSYYLRTRWVDTRLSFNPEQYGNLTENQCTCRKDRQHLETRSLLQK